jgi:hypothetical protein
MKQSVISTILAILVGGSVAGILGLALRDETAASAAATAIGISAGALVWRRFERADRAVR